jgi:hypothetical protein
MHKTIVSRLPPSEQRITTGYFYLFKMLLAQLNDWDSLQKCELIKSIDDPFECS